MLSPVIISLAAAILVLGLLGSLLCTPCNSSSWLYSLCLSQGMPCSLACDPLSAELPAVCCPDSAMFSG